MPEAADPMLHPQARALLELIAQSGAPALHELAPARARTVFRERGRLLQPDPPDVAEVQALQAEGPHGAIGLRLYRPAGSAAGAVLPVLVYYHGGGFVVGDLDTHDTLCRELANGAGCAVVSVDYRLAPEHPFPCAVDDALAAVRWVAREAGALRLDARRLAVGGDSAGGTLAAVVALLARDAGGPPIAFQLLVYPATDARCGAASHERNGQGYLLTRETIAYFLGHYLQDAGRERLLPQASPLLAPDLAGLPPALVLTAGCDPLCDEGLAYAQRLSEAGNRATLASFARQVHGFLTMGRAIDEAHAAVALCAAELRRALGG